MAKFYKTAAIALAATTMVAAAPASATIFEYTLGRDGNHTLTIDTETQTGTWTGAKVNATFTSPDFANFEGGENPTFMATLTSIEGTRLINGQLADVSSDPNHPEMLKTLDGGTAWNLWANWGDPIVGGDFVRSNTGYSVTDVPAPGMLGLFGLALAALGLGWRRRKAAA